MRTTFTSFAFLLVLGLHAQGPSTEQLSTSATNELRMQLDDHLPVGVVADLQVVALHSGQGGTGAALVMYGGPGASFSAQVTLTDAQTGGVIWTQVLHTHSRRGWEEAASELVERAIGPVLAWVRSEDPAIVPTTAQQR